MDIKLYTKQYHLYSDEYLYIVWTKTITKHIYSFEGRIPYVLSGYKLALFAPVLHSLPKYNRRGYVDGLVYSIRIAATYGDDFLRNTDMMTSSNGNVFRVTGHLCGNSPLPGEYPAQRPVTQSYDVFFDLRPNKRLSKQWRGWWFETPSSPLWRHCNETTFVMSCSTGWFEPQYITRGMYDLHT